MLIFKKWTGKKWPGGFFWVLMILIECWRFGVRDCVLLVPVYTCLLLLTLLDQSTPSGNRRHQLDLSRRASVPPPPPLPQTYCSLTPFPQRFTQVYSITSTSDNWTHWQNPYKYTHSVDEDVILLFYYKCYCFFYSWSTRFMAGLQLVHGDRRAATAVIPSVVLTLVVPRHSDITPYVDHTTLKYI